MTDRNPYLYYTAKLTVSSDEPYIVKFTKDRWFSHEYLLHYLNIIIGSNEINDVEILWGQDGSETRSRCVLHFANESDRDMIRDRMVWLESCFDPYGKNGVIYDRLPALTLTGSVSLYGVEDTTLHLLDENKKSDFFQHKILALRLAWLFNNCKGRIYTTSNRWWFEDADDAVQFKLKFGK